VKSRIVASVVLVGLVLLASVLSSCATMVTMTVTRPSEINLRQSRIIAIGEFQGGKIGHALDLGEKFTAKLVQSKYFKSVIDRQNLSGIIKEQDLSLNGLMDDASVIRVGKMIGAAVIVFGRVGIDSYKEETKSEQVERYDAKTDKKVMVTVNTVKGTYTLSVNITITDVETAKILGAKDFLATRSAENRADNKAPAAINDTALYLDCLESVSTQFMKYVVPYQDRVSVVIETDDKIPEVEAAVKFLQAGETERALGLLADAKNRSYKEMDVSAKAYYNYGIVLVYNGSFDEGMHNINEAIARNPKNDLYIEGIKTAKAEKASYEKLRQQMP